MSKIVKMPKFTGHKSLVNYDSIEDPIRRLVLKQSKILLHPALPEEIRNLLIQHDDIADAISRSKRIIIPEKKIEVSDIHKGKEIPEGGYCNIKLKRMESRGTEILRMNGMAANCDYHSIFENVYRKNKNPENEVFVSSISEGPDFSRRKDWQIKFLGMKMLIDGVWGDVESPLHPDDTNEVIRNQLIAANKGMKEIAEMIGVEISK